MNIAAISTPAGIGGIAVIRISGEDAVASVEQIFRPARAHHDLSLRPTHSLTFGRIVDPDEGDAVIDEVIVSIFRSPHSFTGEDVVEISCHGSTFIQQKILSLLLSHNCRMAEPGEFTRRAFRHGKMDLAQAEAVADLIAAGSAASHRLAVAQMRGGVSQRLGELRQQLVELSALLELELDFSEEDVEFADRHKLSALAEELRHQVSTLANTFQTGNAIKNGIPVAIIGETNAGKSTLLNLLLGDDKAIVSDVHGTTRDVIEDLATIDGRQYRFIDTAGIRDTSNRIEQLGIERTFARLDTAAIVLWMIDGTRLGDPHLSGSLTTDVMATLEHIRPHLTHGQHLIILINKADLISPALLHRNLPILQGAINVTIDQPLSYCIISAKTGTGVDELKTQLTHAIELPGWQPGDVVISNVRHHQALCDAEAALGRVLQGLSTGIPADLVAQDLRQCAFHLGSITGAVTTDEILGTIFSRFCVGK